MLQHATYVLTAPSWFVPIALGVVLALGFLWGRFESTAPEMDKRRAVYTINLPIWGVPLIVGGLIAFGYFWGAQ